MCASARSAVFRAAYGNLLQILSCVCVLVSRERGDLGAGEIENWGNWGRRCLLVSIEYNLIRWTYACSLINWLLNCLHWH